MITSINPETSNVDEYTNFNITYALTYDEMSIDPEIEEVIITSPSGDFSSNVSIVIHSEVLFSVSGMFADVFNREMHYIMPDKNFYMVTKWVDIPEDFETVYKYKGAQQNSITLNVNVVTTEGSISAQIFVNNNYTAANAKLVEYIARGVY